MCRHSFLASWQSRLSHGCYGISMPRPVWRVVACSSPWSIRYASEARGYSFVIFIVPVLLSSGEERWSSGSGRWWSAYALAFSLFYCYPGSAFILIVLNLLTAGPSRAAPGCAEPRFAQSRSLVLRQYAGSYARASVHASTLSAGEALFRFCLLAGIRLRLAMGPQYCCLHDRRSSLDEKR